MGYVFFAYTYNNLALAFKVSVKGKKKAQK